jgi:hypothetical protein
MASVPETPSSASVKAVVWFLACSSALFLALRLLCKHCGRGFHWDDLVLVAAWVSFRRSVVRLDAVAPLKTVF